MSDSIALWHAEHATFVTLLDLLEDQLERFQRGASPDYELMLNIMFYMTHYPDALHHPKEDMAFAVIHERERSAGPIIDALSEQHARLKESGDGLVRELDNIVNGSIASREHLETSGRAYIADFRRHIEREETAMLPLAAKLLDDSDWKVIDAAISQLDDPLFGKDKQRRYGALRRQIALDARVPKTLPH
jgi:hemerythrin-like domain-containing protein